LNSYDQIKPLSKRLGTLFLGFGLGLLFFSYFLTSQIMAFIGLGLSFWGALFFLITPVVFVEGNVMVNTLTSSYSTTERIIKDLDCKGKGFHIPPYPERTYLPEHLKGLKEMVVYIPKEAETTKPLSLDELSEHKFMLKNSQGILLTPPGLGLLTTIERKSRLDFTKLSVDELCKALSKSILDNFSLAKEIVMVAKDNEVNVKIKQSLYSKLYTDGMFERSVTLLGCPIVSSIACALAKSSAKTINIEKVTFSSDGQTIEAQYRISQVD
jgi:hypothetical protein